MTKYKFLKDIKLVDGTEYKKGDVAKLENERAEALVGAGYCKKAKAKPKKEKE